MGRPIDDEAEELGRPTSRRPACVSMIALAGRDGDRTRTGGIRTVSDGEGDRARTDAGDRQRARIGGERAGERAGVGERDGDTCMKGVGVSRSVAAMAGEGVSIRVAAGEAGGVKPADTCEAGVGGT
jgi:hypothetical protein